jgi:hypothetical protein
VAKKTVEFLTTLEVDTKNVYLNGEHSFGTYTPDNIEYLITFPKKRSKIVSELIKEYKFDVSSNINTDIRFRKIFCKIELESSFVKQKTDGATAIRLLQFINHFIVVTEIFTTSFNLPKFKMDGRLILCRPDNKSAWKKLDYQYNEINYHAIFEEFSMIGETGHWDLIMGYAGNIDSIELSWKLLCNAINQYYQGNFREVLIDCCSAIEIEVSPKISEWLIKCAGTGAKDSIGNAVREMGNPLRFSIYMKTIRPNPFTENLTESESKVLFSGLCKTNSTRNHVIHEGYTPTKKEAIDAIHNTGKFLRYDWRNRMGWDNPEPPILKTDEEAPPLRR